MAAIADVNKKLHKRSSSAAKASASSIFAVSDANGRLLKRSSSSGKAGIRLPAIPYSKRLSLHAALAARRSASKRFAEGSLTMLKEAFASCQDIEMDAEIQAEHMLKYQELKFKSCLPKLSEVLSDAEARMPSKLQKGCQGYVFAGLQELKETSQRKILEADRADVAQLVSKNKVELPIKDRDPVNSLTRETQPLAQAKERSNSARPQSELRDKLESNYPLFRKRFHLVRDDASDGVNLKQACQSPGAVATLRPQLAGSCNFQQ